MLRTIALPAATLLGLTLLAPSSAIAAGEACQGQPATGVGTRVSCSPAPRARTCSCPTARPGWTLAAATT